MKLVVRFLVIAACLIAAPANSYWQSRQQVSSDQDVPTVDLNFAAGTVAGGCSSFANCLTVSRAQTVLSYAQTVAGTLTAFSADTPRITDKGLLIEEARTNLALQSQNFASATWGVFGTGASKVGPAPVNDPAEGSTAYQVNMGSVGGGISSAGALFQNITYAAAAYTHAIYIMAASGTSTIRISITDVTAATTGTSDIPINSTTWTRIPVTVTTAAGGGNIAVRNNAAGNSGIVYVAFAQAELGAFPTSYIPTTTVAVTRAADNVTFAGALDTALKATPGSLVIQNNPVIPMTSFVATPPSLTSLSGGWASIAFGTTTSRVSDGTNNIDATFGAGSFAGLAKTGIAYDGATGSIVANNGTVGIGTLLRTTATGNNNLGNVSALNRSVNGYIPRLTVWNTRLSDASLKELTQ